MLSVYFCLVGQKAHSAGDPTPLAKDYKADWDRQVEHWQQLLGRDLQLLGRPSRLLWAACGNLRRSRYVTGDLWCMSEGELRHQSPLLSFTLLRQPLVQRLKLANSNFPNDNAELTAFNKFNNNEFV
jgi:hypothetical protein